MDETIYTTGHREGQHLTSEERPETVDLREEFGHWEIDSVLGKKIETLTR